VTGRSERDGDGGEGEEEERRRRRRSRRSDCPVRRWPAAFKCSAEGNLIAV
jgi:hypothetical protein